MSKKPKKLQKSVLAKATTKKTSELKFSKEKRQELAKRYNASEDKVQQFETIFQELDKDEKGALDKGTFMKAALKLGFALAPKHADKILKIYAGAKGVGIDVDGFVVAMLHKMKWGKEDIKKDAEKMFKTFDKNGDGCLSPEELREGMEKIGDPMTEEEAKELFAMADKNNDGKISYEEFLDLWNQIYN